MRAGKRFACQVCILVLAAFADSASAGGPVAPRFIKAVYSAYMNGMALGVITETFDATAGAYRITSETKPMGVGTLVQRHPLRFLSRGEIGPEGLRPTHFEARRGAADSPQAIAEFDWPQAQLQLKHDAKVESLPLNPGTQDRLSIMYQFTFVRLDKARYVDFWMTNGRKLDQYRYRVTHDVDMDTALGRLKTTHLAKDREAGETHTEVWISPRHHNLAVKLVIVEKDGMRYEQILQSLDIRE